MRVELPAETSPSSDPVAQPRARVHRSLKVARLAVALAVAVIAIATACGVLGYGFASQSDASYAESRREAVRATISEFRELSIDGADPRLLQVIERSAGVHGLRFETDAAFDAREVLPVLNTQGRISGFLTWDAEQPMTATVSRLLPLAAILAVALAGFAAFSLRQLQRARHDLKDGEALARQASEIDALTGRPNSERTVALLKTVLAQRAEHEVMTLCLIELSGMHELGDQVGVQGRNDVIANSAHRLAEALPAGALSGRYGDGFAVALGGDTDVVADIRNIFDAIERPQWLDTVLRVGAHAGYAQVPRDAQNCDELLRRAELAMRAAAQKGPGTIVAFEPEIDARAEQHRFIRRELPRALAAQALDLHFQPIVASDGSRIVGVEALARWRHSEKGDIPPGAFIPVAEQMGLIKQLGGFVLRRALSEAHRWPDCYVAVNMSPVQARDHDFVDLVRGALREHGVEPSRLMLEITEGVLIDNPDEMIARIEELRALGVRIALDDFGSGYSNLGYLQRFPFDKLKIDRSFITPLGRTDNGGVILQAMVALGRALGVSVLAEGVETEEQRVLLRLAGCDEMQGYLFARPMPAAATERLIDTRRTARPAALTA